MTLWKLVFAEPGGFRVFQCVDRENLRYLQFAIADRSGDTPENTDDGILWLSAWSGNVLLRGGRLNVRVDSERDKDCAWVMVSEGLAKWLLWDRGWLLRFDPDLDIETDEFGVARVHKRQRLVSLSDKTVANTVERRG